MKKLLLAAAAALVLASCHVQRAESPWQMRGVVLTTEDLASVEEWPRMAAECGLNTIGTHITPSEVTAFLAREEGQRFLESCQSLGIAVEHQLHAMGELLPRSLFAVDSLMFRMDSLGRRNPDFNCCPHSERALDTIAANAARLAAILRPDNHRYYFWMDDGAPTCLCPQCRELLPSEQALLIENRMLRSIRRIDPLARLAHLAFSNTLEAPRKVRPEEGIFLEFAPIYRSWDAPLKDEAAVCPRGFPFTNGDNLRRLEENLEVFAAEDAVVLEYWLDVSLFSGWRKPSVQLPWRPDVCAADLTTYAGYGIRNVTSFAAYMDSAYFARFPSLAPLKEYGRQLTKSLCKYAEHAR